MGGYDYKDRYEPLAGAKVAKEEETTMGYPNPEYSVGETGTKFLKVTVGGLSIGSVLLFAIGWVRARWPQAVFWTPEQDEKAAAVVVSMAAGAYVAIRNWAKNGESGASGATLAILKKVWMGVILLGLAPAFMGCGTMNPAVYGKTSYRMSFEDTVTAGVDPETGAATPGQTTVFNVDVKAPAGVKIEDLTSMGYEWKDGEGKISVSKTATQDSSGQAEMIPLYAQIQAQNFANAIEGVKSLAQSATGLIGLNLQNSADDAARDDAGRAATRAEIATIVREVLALQKETGGGAGTGE